MADSASSSSSAASSKCSSDTEMMVKPKRAKVPKHCKVGQRHKHKMKLQSSKQKHYHKKQQSKLNSSTDSEHRHKKSGRKRRAPQKRKRKPHSPSSETSSASEENSDVSLDIESLSSDESSSEQCTSRKEPKHSKYSAKHKRKKAKLSPKDSKTSARNNQLRAVFRNHFGDLVLLISNPELLAAQLFSKSLISSATLDEIMTLPNSQLKKTLHLLLDLKRKIQADPEKLFTFIDVIQKDSSLEEVGERMSGMSIFCYINGTLQRSHVWLLHLL